MARAHKTQPQFISSVAAKPGLRLPGLSPAAKESRAGRALRKRIHRKSHATIGRVSTSRDPVSIIIASDKGRVEKLVPIRHTRMLESPFTYFRGAAANQASDLAHAPSTGILTQCCGDSHLMNFGGFATPERNFVFDINDFDETFPAPFEWDLKRLAASFVLAARWRGISDHRATDIATTAARSYGSEIALAAGENTLDTWYAAVDWKDVLREVRDDPAASKSLKKVSIEAKHHTSEHVFHKLAALKGGKIVLHDQPPLLYHPPWLDVTAKMARFFKAYVKTLRQSQQHLFARLRMVDAAFKVVGVGSVGTRCYVALMLGSHGDPLFLQVKEARTSVLEQFAGPSLWRNQGHRVVSGQRMMQGVSDIFLGWSRGLDGRDYYVRQLRDMKLAADLAAVDAKTLVLYARLCGRTLARAHAKGGEAPQIAGYLGSSSTFDDAIIRYALAYADQVERDYQAFQAAAPNGRIPIQRAPL
jgi:uncharacterized protein (DUF2252 family)